MSPVVRRALARLFGTAPALLAVGWLSSGGLGCEPPPCEESIRAQVIEQRVRLDIGDESIEVEVADEPTERERGWMHRRCGREGLLLVPDMRQALPVWGCGLTDAVDLHLVRDAAVIDVILDVEPCDAPCGSCPLYADGVEVDAIVETVAGTLTAPSGSPVMGLP